MEGKGEEGGGGGGWGKVCFLSRMKETLMVNVTPRQINLTARQMMQINRVTSFSLTVCTNP